MGEEFLRGGGRFAPLSHNFKIEVSYFKYIKPMEWYGGRIP